MMRKPLIIAAFVILICAIVIPVLYLQNKLSQLRPNPQLSSESSTKPEKRVIKTLQKDSSPLDSKRSDEIATESNTNSKQNAVANLGEEPLQQALTSKSSDPRPFTTETSIRSPLAKSTRDEPKLLRQKSLSQKRLLHELWQNSCNKRAKNPAAIHRRCHIPYVVDYQMSNYYTESMSRILLVDDDAGLLSVLSTLLKAEGYDVLPIREGEKASELIRSEDFDLMIADIRMSPVNGMELLALARSERPDMSVIMFTAYATIETAIEAMKLGAFDYVTKPFKVDELIVIIRRALEYKKALTENVDLKAQLKARYRFENIVAESPSMKNVCQMIERVAPTDVTVLIYGESGTGKELVAKALHAYSHRKNNKFLAVNCAALPEPLLESEMFGHVKGAFTGASSDKKGLFEAAEGGTIFLDEIGSIPLSMQGKLLRVLQEKEVRRVGGNENIKVDARVLASTNIRLDELMKTGKFREDLFYRLSVIPIAIEPLRNRKEDIMPLAYHVIRREIDQNRDMPTIAPDVHVILESYSWPGNVRELENAIRHAITFATGNKITKDILPPKIASAVDEIHPVPDTYEVSNGFRFESLKAFIRSMEKEYLEQVVNAVGGDKQKAASALKISMATLYRKLPKDQT